MWLILNGDEIDLEFDRVGFGLEPRHDEMGVKIDWLWLVLNLDVCAGFEALIVIVDLKERFLWSSDRSCGLSIDWMCRILNFYGRGVDL